MGQLIRKNVCQVVVLLLLVSWHQIWAQSISLDTCYARAVNNYPLIKQYGLIDKSRDYTLSNANKAYLPQVNLTGIAGYIIGGFPGSTDNSDNFKLIGIGQINQTIWDGGATKAQKETIAATADSEKASVEVALYDLRSRVIQLYFGILMVDEQLTQLGQRQTVLNNNMDRVNLMVENGLAFKIDRDEIKVEELKLNQQKTEFNYVRKGYVMMLSLLTGMKINEQSQFEKPLVRNLPLEMEIARPELGMYEKQRKVINAQDNMRRVNLMPKVGLLGAGILLDPGIGIGAGKMTSIGVVGLSTSWNINGLYKNANEKQLTQLALDKINQQEETFKFNTNLQTTQIQANIEKQKAIITEDQEIVDLRQRIREGYQLKYNNGMGSMLDLLDATEKEGEAKTQKALHEMQLLLTQYEYKTTTGN